MPSPGKKRTHIKRSVKQRSTLSAFVLLILALGFNALLSLNSLEKLYVESIASQYSAIGKDLQRNLEKSLRFGKSLKKFIGIDKMLEETKNNLIKEYSQDTTTSIAMNPVSASDISVSIALPDGLILYSTEENLVNTTLPKQVRIVYEDSEDDNPSSREESYVKYKNTYTTPLPIRDMKKKWLATAIITFNEKQVRELLATVRNNSIKMILIILASSIILLIVLLNVATLGETIPYKSLRLRISIIMLLVIGLAQIVFSGWNTDAFRRYYLRINKQKTRTLTTLLKEDIEFLFSKGIRINKLEKMDVVMGEIIEASPELRDITIADKHGIPLYMAAKEGIFDFRKATEEQLKLAYRLMGVVDPEYNIHLDLLKGDEQEGNISTNLSKDVILAKLFGIALDSTTILVISFLFFGELLILIFVYIERQVTAANLSKKIHYGAIRPAAFLFMFGSAVTISFLPLYMETLYAPIFGLSKDMVMGLPISVKMFFTGLAIVIAGTWLDRRGWHEPFLFGLLLAGIGGVYSWLAPNALYFILAQGGVGLGYGLSFMASQGFVIVYTDEHNKTQGLAQFFAGSWAGTICGNATGAMLAERIGYRPVFFFGAIILFSVIAYTLLFMRRTLQKPKHGSTKQAAKHVARSVGSGQMARFFLNRSVFSLILFSSIPAALALVGFLNYFSPIYLKGIGTSQSNIGRIFMINGLCLIYIAPFISKYIDKSTSKKMYIVISGLLGSLALISFYYIGGLAAAAIAVLLLGLSNSLGSSRNSYFLKIKVTQELGAGKAMGIFASAARIGQVIGPILFGWLIVVAGFDGIVYVGLAYLLVTAFFLLVTLGDKKLSVIEDRKA